MKRFSQRAVLVALGTSLGIFACSGKDVPIGQDTSGDGKGGTDAATTSCGSTECSAGQLCCASADETCSPTCMTVTQCPVYGRPCKVPTDGGAESDGGVQVDAASTLRWYHTCGDPVCHDPPDAGGPVDSGVCATPGTPCTQKGQTCGDGTYTCGVILVCDDHDPSAGNCPISSAKFKDGIAYLSDAELDRMHEETLATRLATYQYKASFDDRGVTHLGFIIEDQPQSLAVDRGHDRVDLYGYVSMVVASMQVQEKEIQALKREVREARAACSEKALPKGR